MAQLEHQIKIEIQQTMIDELSSKLRDLEGDFQVESKLKDRELALLRQKCERFQNRVKELEDNSPKDEQMKFDRIQNTLDALLKENELLKKANQDMSSEIVELKSQLATGLKVASMASCDSENDSCIDELNDHTECKNGGEMSSDKCTDLCVIELTELNEDAVTAVVECYDQRAEEVQQSHTRNDSTDTLENTVGIQSNVETTLTRLEEELTFLDATKNDMASTSVEERCYQVATELTHSELNAVNVHIGALKTTENDKETQYIDNVLNNYLKFNPVGALQELCMSRSWNLPGYKFFGDGPKKSTYSVECTVMSCTVRVEGMMKKAAKRQAATLMYYKLENSTGSNTSMGTLAGLDEEPAGSPSSFDSHRDGHFVQDQNHSVTTTEDDKKVQQTERVKLDAELISNPFADNGIVGGTCVFTSVGCPEIPVIADVVDAPAFTVGEYEIPARVNEESTFEMPKEVVDQWAIPTEHVTERLPVASVRPDYSESHAPPVNDSAIVSDDEYYVMSPINADFANHFRQSNNPSVRELKEANDVSMLSLPSSLEFLEQIADEEGLVMDFDYYPSSTPKTEDELTTIQLTINHCALTVVGYGETLIDGQEDAAYECLLHFKSIL